MAAKTMVERYGRLENLRIASAAAERRYLTECEAVRLIHVTRDEAYDKWTAAKNAFTAEATLIGRQG